MAKLIYVQGAQGVGKSTLLEAYACSTNLKVKKFDEIARSLMKNGVTHGSHAKKEDYFAYIHRHIYNHNFFISNRDKYDVFISDRSIIDVIVYSLICFNDTQVNYVYELCCEFYKLIANRIDTILYLPIEFELVDDGVREFSVEFQSAYDASLIKVFNDLQIEYRTLRGSVDRRLQELTKIINEPR